MGGVHEWTFNCGFSFAEENGQSQPAEDSSHHDESFVPKSLVDCLKR